MRFSVFAIFVVLLLFTAACGAAPSGTPFPVSVVEADLNDPASVVNAFFVARSAFDIDTAMQYVNESTTIESEGTHSGAGEIRDFIQDRANKNFQFEVTSTQVNGDQVDFTFKVYLNGEEINQIDGQATVQNGVIVYMDEGV